MATLQFDVDDFRAQFPGLFPDPPNTDAIIEIFWSAAICYVSPDTSGPLSADCRRQVLNLVTAHLITLSESAQAGNQPGFVVSASIDKISVSIQAPPSKTAFQFFLNQTPFGIQAYALLYAAGAGGSYLGGFNELGSFRRAGGVFSPPSQTISEPEGTDSCPLLTVPPVAPYTFTLPEFATGFGETQAISVPEGCDSISIAIPSTTVGLPGTYTVEFWTGISLDSGNRISAFYWGSDARLANTFPDSQAINQNPTGENLGDGFQMAGLVPGTLGATPDLLAVTGFTVASEQILNVNVFRVA